MARLVRLFGTSLGKKLLVAVTGLVLVAFVVGHLAGNMTVFQGPEVMNAYAAWLRGNPLLWLVRAGMLAVLALHVGMAVLVARENRAARPVRYAHAETIRMSFGERHILLTGVLVLAFLVYHLLHLTVGTVDPAGAHALVDAAGRPDVYARVVLGFSNPWVAGSYLVALLVLGLHLQHALRSLFQTLGFSHQSYQGIIESVCAVVPALLVLGYASIPVLVLAGVVTMPAGDAS